MISFYDVLISLYDISSCMKFIVVGWHILRFIVRCKGTIFYFPVKRFVLFRNVFGDNSSLPNLPVFISLYILISLKMLASMGKYPARSAIRFICMHKPVPGCCTFYMVWLLVFLSFILITLKILFSFYYLLQSYISLRKLRFHSLALKIKSGRTFSRRTF